MRRSATMPLSGRWRRWPAGTAAGFCLLSNGVTHCVVKLHLNYLHLRTSVCYPPPPRFNPQSKKYLKNFRLPADVGRVFGCSPLFTGDSGVWPGCCTGAVGAAAGTRWAEFTPLKWGNMAWNLKRMYALKNLGHAQDRLIMEKAFVALAPEP